MSETTEPKLHVIVTNKWNTVCIEHPEFPIYQPVRALIRSRSKYKPHQGVKECSRRVEQKSLDSNRNPAT